MSGGKILCIVSQGTPVDVGTTVWNQFNIVVSFGLATKTNDTLLIQSAGN